MCIGVKSNAKFRGIFVLFNINSQHNILKFRDLKIYARSIFLNLGLILCTKEAEKIFKVRITKGLVVNISKVYEEYIHYCIKILE